MKRRSSRGHLLEAAVLMLGLALALALISAANPVPRLSFDTAFQLSP